MIKATIRNSPYCTEITFPCSETELSKKLGELGMNPAHLSPMATVIEIEPSELSVLEDCEVSLDALNYLGKRLDGMDELEQKRFLAALSCEEAEIGYGLKNIINLTYNLEHFTLIEDTSDLEKAGLTHMLVIRGGLSVTESQNKDWLIAEGRKLLDSGKGIDTGYGTLFINEEFPFRDVFNGTTFPAYYCESNSVLSVELGFQIRRSLSSCRARKSLSKRRCADSARTIFLTAKFKWTRAGIFPMSSGKKSARSKRQRMYSG